MNNILCADCCELRGDLNEWGLCADCQLRREHRRYSQDFFVPVEGKREGICKRCGNDVPWRSDNHLCAQCTFRYLPNLHESGRAAILEYWDSPAGRARRERARRAKYEVKVRGRG